MSSRSKKASPPEQRPSARSSGKRWTEWEIEYVLKHWKGSKDSGAISSEFWSRRRIHRTKTAINKMAVNVLGIRGGNLEGFTSLTKVAPNTCTSTVRLLCKELGIKVTTVSHCLAVVPNADVERLRDRLIPPKGWLTTKIAAKRAKMSDCRLREYVRQGAILGKRYCVNNWRICPASLASFIAAHGRATLMLESGKWVTSTKAANRLGITNAALACLIRQGKIPAQKMSVPGSIGLAFVLETAKVEALASEREAKGAVKPGKWAENELKALREALKSTKDLGLVSAHLTQQGIRCSSKAIARQAQKLGMLPKAAA